MHASCSNLVRMVFLMQLGAHMPSSGAKSREHIYEAFEAIYPVLQQFRKGEAQPAAALPAAPQQQLRLPAPPQVRAPSCCGAQRVAVQGRMQHISMPLHTWGKGVASLPHRAGVAKNFQQAWEGRLAN